MRAAERITAEAGPENHDRHNLIHRRTELEARLIAHLCGWRALDEVRLHRLYGSLASVLDALGGRDPAESLIPGHAARSIRS